jgi:hypothetical protein
MARLRHDGISATEEVPTRKEEFMPRYLFLYRSDKETFSTMKPEELQLFHQRWRIWIADGQKKGGLLGTRTALKTDGRVINADKIVSNGPLVENRNVVRGYVNVESDTFDSASELAKGCPVLLHRGAVEVRPFWEGIPGMK